MKAVPEDSNVDAATAAVVRLVARNTRGLAAWGADETGGSMATAMCGGRMVSATAGVKGRGSTRGAATDAGGAATDDSREFTRDFPHC
jgi:hypothetical protein